MYLYLLHDHEIKLYTLDNVRMQGCERLTLLQSSNRFIGLGYRMHENSYLVCFKETKQAIALSKTISISSDMCLCPAKGSMIFQKAKANAKIPRRPFVICERPIKDLMMVRKQFGIGVIILDNLLDDTPNSVSYEATAYDPVFDIEAFRAYCSYQVLPLSEK